MELLDEDTDKEVKEIEHVLNRETVAAIEIARGIDPRLGGEGKSKRIKEPWGPILVERPMRGHNRGISMMQKAMELKKMKNLEIRGNPFAVLYSKNLQNLACDIKLQVGSNKAESQMIFDNPLEMEKKNYDNFVDDHPEVTLPANLDNEVFASVSGNNQSHELDIVTPTDSFKESQPAIPWREVVKRGKTKSKSSKIGDNDRHILEY
jgi:hypothetical protein